MLKTRVTFCGINMINLYVFLVYSVVDEYYKAPPCDVVRTKKSKFSSVLVEVSSITSSRVCEPSFSRDRFRTILESTQVIFFNSTF